MTKVPGDTRKWRLVLSICASMSYLAILMAKLSFGDRIANMSSGNTTPTSTPISVAASNWYLLVIPLFLALFFLPRLVRIVLGSLHRERTFGADITTRWLFVVVAVMVFALPPWLFTEHSLRYLLYFLAIGFAFGLVEHAWAHEFVRSITAEKTPDLSRPEISRDAQIRLYEMKIEIVKFEDNKWWRAFQFLWAVLIAVVVSGVITIAAAQHTEEPVGQYSLREIFALAAAGLLVVPPVVFYFVEKTNSAQSKIEEIYRDMHALYESTSVQSPTRSQDERACAPKTAGEETRDSA